jgi:aspartyl-tRNA(Asn)/glutamyl-tRNA(Gln) amidotransferase subunit A
VIDALAERLSSRTLSAEALLDETLARIEAARPLNAFLHVDEPGARAAARAADDRAARGERRGALDGVPIALKDNLVTEGVPTTAASRILAGWRPPYDAHVVSQLRAAGAVLVGKTNMDELAMGSSSEHSAYGPVLNPWDPTRVPGGSSGGSAVAVAARLVPASLGSDTGGSIRQPAALTGVLGLKPTYGRVSRRGLIAFASSLDQIGPFATTAIDLAHVLAAIAGHDPGDATCLDAPLPAWVEAARSARVEGLRIGVPRRVLGRRPRPRRARRL